MDKINLILRENSINHSLRMAKVKRRLKINKAVHKEIAMQMQMQLCLSPSLWVEKLLCTIKADSDYDKMYMKPKVRKNDVQNMFLHYTSSQWIENFRMTKETFLFICAIVNDDLEPKTHLAAADNHQSLSVEKQVAISIYKLANSCQLRIVATMFGVGKSTAHKCLHNFCENLNKHVKKFIYMPSDDEAIKYSEDFEKQCKIPQIIGCINSTHIPILTPKKGYNDFVNSKYWTSFNIQAICNAELLFLDISCKLPGGLDDTHVFVNSGIYKNIQNILPQGRKEIDGKNIPYLILGDPAYPLLPWVMKNFENTTDKEEISFNSYMNTGRVTIENAFMRLKSRWHILSKRFDLFYKNAPKIILTCCILHNICEKNDKDLNNMVFPHPPKEYVQPTRAASTNTDTLEGTEIREHLKLYINKNFPLRDDW